MQLLFFLALTGALSGSITGAYWSGTQGLILGGTSGLVLGVTTWFLAGIVLRAIREVRLDRYFTQDSDLD